MTMATRRGGDRGFRRGPIDMAAIFLLAGLAAGCGRDFNAFPDLDRPATAVGYDVELTGAPNERAAELIEDSLLVYRRQEVGAQSLALLRRRAREDAETVLKILRSLGYYEGEVEIDVDRVAELAPEPVTATGTISGVAETVTDFAAGTVRAVTAPFREESGEPDPPELDLDEPPPGGYARVTIAIDPGPPFILADHDLVLFDSGPEPAPTIPSARQFGSPVGERAAAAPIVAAEGEALDMLQHIGRPYATQRGRDSVADLEEEIVEVDTFIATGREYAFGDTRIAGAPQVRDDYVLTYRPYVTGERVDTRELALFQERLVETGLFDAVSVGLPEEPPVGDSAPVFVTLDERPPRTVGAGVEYSTSLGPAANFTFEHRNLAGANETVLLEGFVGMDLQELDVFYRKPQWRRPFQDLTAGLSLERLEDDVYDGLTATARLGVEREIGEFWSVGAGGLIEASLVEDEGRDTRSYLAGLPVFAEFDDRDDILDPTRGVRMRADVVPFAGARRGDFVSFLKSELNGSTYWDITDDETYILAVRGRIGSILAPDLDDVPQPRRFYAGGAGSVRGYDYRLIGPLDEDDNPIGGRSVAEAAVELRAPLLPEWNLGGAAFVDAGTVSTQVIPTFDEAPQVGAGLGLRYASPVGPIRFDVAVPVNPRDIDDSFQFYISIGQAF